MKTSKRFIFKHSQYIYLKELLKTLKAHFKLNFFTFLSRLYHVSWIYCFGFLFHLQSRVTGEYLLFLVTLFQVVQYYSMNKNVLVLWIWIKEKKRKSIFGFYCLCLFKEKRSLLSYPHLAVYSKITERYIE